MLRELNLRRELAVERDPARADDLRQEAAAARRVRYYRNFWGKNLNQIILIPLPQEWRETDDEELTGAVVTIVLVPVILHVTVWTELTLI